LEIKYFSNILELGDLSDTEILRANKTTNQLKEDISRWSSGVRIKKWGEQKTITSLFKWKGMSTWWINRLAHKDNSISTKWISRLNILYLAREFSRDEVVDLHTDDRLLIKALEKNKSEISVNVFFKPQRFYIFEILSNSARKIKSITVSFLVHIRTYLLLINSSKKFGHMKHDHSPIWFKTSYPMNWSNGHASVDRLYGKLPLLDSKFGFESRYLAFISSARPKFYNLWVGINNLHKQSGRKTAFPEGELTLLDILLVYFSTFSEQIRFSQLRKSQSFNKIFFLGKLDATDILLAEWSESYWGYQQFSKLQGIAMSKFFCKIKPAQTIVTYGEFFPQNRACYFMTKNAKPDTKFIALQHAVNGKNKLLSYFRAEEFLYDGLNHGNKYSPCPDYFLVQGEQYKKILSTFFPPKNFVIVGSLKQLKKPEFLNNSILKKLIKNNNNKLLLLAPSAGEDYKIIFSFFEKWIVPDDWKIILCPHPILNVSDIKKYHSKYFSQVPVIFFEKGTTYQVLSEAHVVVSVNSTVGLEASLFGAVAVKILPPGYIVQLDEDNRVLSFSSKSVFQSWMNSYTPKKVINSTVYDSYFYKNDGKAADRIWNFIKQISNQNEKR